MLLFEVREEIVTICPVCGLLNEIKYSPSENIRP